MCVRGRVVRAGRGLASTHVCPPWLCATFLMLMPLHESLAHPARPAVRVGSLQRTFNRSASSVTTTFFSEYLLFCRLRKNLRANFAETPTRRLPIEFTTSQNKVPRQNSGRQCTRLQAYMVARG
ncbi:hypothetical protein C8Q78DRAFT_483500 [Trametes maxima]|nr:hypothetical protein C8Q78DRAFT_483500 [Trametes maxima]